MPTICLTYVLDDNANSDVDFVVQELLRAGIQVKRALWNTRSSKSLWEQIERPLLEGTGADAWLMYATQNSLGSESCKEEFLHAIGLAVDRRGKEFPVIALFLGPADENVMPVGPRAHLQVSLADLEWKERIVAAAEGGSRSSARPELEPFTIQIYPIVSPNGHRLAIEVRPRAGTWSPFFAAVPLSEKDLVQPCIADGPRGRVPEGCESRDSVGTSSIDDAWWVMYAQNEATPTQSYYIYCHEQPSRLAFGVNGRRPQFVVADLHLYSSQFS